ncbi:hypothetical protein [Mesorhizobium sp. M1300]|uniref:hypothetical protein n=1 Tax=Mesorhizobium sp. M1300 TaxID=2957077 RepID=UPI003339AE9B
MLELTDPVMKGRAEVRGACGRARSPSRGKPGKGGKCLNQANCPSLTFRSHRDGRSQPRPKPGERKSKAIKRALAQEEGRYHLRDLKRAHAREAKHYVNCPLDYDTKLRLQKAAFDNDIKMTVIIKAAIDQFLRDNGY